MKTSWYKEPWAWLVFFLPLSAVIAGITTLIIANNNPVSLVTGDYYKKGKAINLELSKVKHAQKLGMKFNLNITDDQLHIIPTGIEKYFPLLNINFYHPTQEFKDIALVVTPDGNGHFRHQLEMPLEGKWKITISSFTNDWKIEQTIALPQTSAIEIVPMPTKTHN